MPASGPRARLPDFFFVRHGETDWNREGRLQGRRDVGLNALGRRQAVAAGTTLARLLLSRGRQAADLDFVASPLSRTQDTMEAVRRELGLEPEPYRRDARLLELSFGWWEGLTWGEIKRRDAAAAEARRRDRWNFVPPGGESYADLRDRVAPWLAELEPDSVVVAHGGVARALMHLVAGVSAGRAPNQEVPQGRVLVFENGTARWV